MPTASTNDVPARDARFTYREFDPGPLLSRDIVCLWTQTIRAGETYLHPILPDGCMDLVWIDEQPPLVVGPMTHPVLYPLPPGARLLGVRFFPGAATNWLRVPASALTDLEIPLQETWGASVSALTAQLAETPTIERKLRLLRTALESRARFVASDRALAASVSWIARHPGGDVRRLADVLGVTPRHLRRRFRHAVGYGPKTLQRIIRFQRLLHLAATLPSRPAALATLAFEAGYADQAHMTREFRQLASDTPAHLLFQTSSALALSGWFET